MHACKGFFIGCMDFRLCSTAVPKFLDSLGLMGDCDSCVVAGGAKDLEQLEKMLSLSIRLHGASRVVLTVHEDCGAGATKDDLAVATKLVEEKFPSCSIERYFLKLNGTWEKIK